MGRRRVENDRRVRQTPSEPSVNEARLLAPVGRGPGVHFLNPNTPENTFLCANREAHVWSRFRVHLHPGAKLLFR